MDMKKSDERAIEVKIEEKDFIFATDHVFRGLTVSKKEDGWSVSIRATSKDGVDVYAMSWGSTHENLVSDLVRLLSGKEAKYIWRLDNWGK